MQSLKSVWQQRGLRWLNLKPDVAWMAISSVNGTSSWKHCGSTAGSCSEPVTVASVARVDLRSKEDLMRCLAQLSLLAQLSASPSQLELSWYGRRGRRGGSSWQGPPPPFGLSHLVSNKLTIFLQGLPVPKQLSKVAEAFRGTVISWMCRHGIIKGSLVEKLPVYEVFKIQSVQFSHSSIKEQVRYQFSQVLVQSSNRPVKQEFRVSSSVK